MHRSTGVFVALLALANARIASGTCGQAFCPIESAARAERLPVAGELTLDASWEYIDQDQPRIGTSRARVGELPSPEHDEIETLNRTYKLLAEYGITRRLAAGFLFPVVQRNHLHLELEGGELERWNFARVGDVQVWGRYSLVAPANPADWGFSLGVGLKLPTGPTHVRNEEGDVAEITLQPGTGSTDALLLAHLVQPVSVRRVVGGHAWAPFFASTVARITGSDGRDGYRAGTDVFVNLGAAYPVVSRLHLLGQVNFRYRDRDDAGAAEGVPERNTGGEFLFLSPGIRARLLRELWAYAVVQVPVFQRVNGIQLTADWHVLLGGSYQFSLPALGSTTSVNAW